jgi:hypothetical protein
VVKGQRRQLCRVEPRRIARIGITLGRVLVRPDEGVKGDGHDPPPRVPPRIPEGAQLFQKDSRETGLLQQFPTCRRFQVFVHEHEASRQRPRADEGFHAAPDQQDLEPRPLKPKTTQSTVRCWSRIFVGVSHQVTVE